MAERQQHGFLYEDAFIKRFDLIKENNYTNKYDAYDRGGIPYKIKNIKLGSSIDLSDFFRNANEDKDFRLVVSFWKDSTDNIVEEYMINIPAIEWQELLYFEQSYDMREWIHHVSNAHDYDAQWRRELNYFKDKWNEDESRKIQLRFKRDHKTQKRIQCAVNNTDWYSYFLKHFEVIWEWHKN